MHSRALAKEPPVCPTRTLPKFCLGQISPYSASVGANDCLPDGSVPIREMLLLEELDYRLNVVFSYLSPPHLPTSLAGLLNF